MENVSLKFSTKLTACTGTFKIVAILEAQVKYHLPRHESSVSGTFRVSAQNYLAIDQCQRIFVRIGSGHRNLGRFCPHIWLIHLWEISKILSAQAYGLSGFSSNFCPHRDQSLDRTFTGPGAVTLATSLLRCDVNNLPESLVSTRTVT